jgi:CO/xanthine dehydrogenase Mo-binding subunit
MRAARSSPSYVEGQYQGGAVQGIGWALNEEYIYGEDGRLQNAGFLDYRIPVASDLPMIDTVIVEVPNPGHPVRRARRRRDASNR